MKFAEALDEYLNCRDMLKESYRLKPDAVESIQETQEYWRERLNEFFGPKEL